jgi:hypothetical protein
MPSEKVMPFICNMAKRLGREYGCELMRLYRTILDWSLEDTENTPDREEVWPVSRLARVFFPRVYPNGYEGGPKIPKAAVRMALKDLLEIDERKKIAGRYKVWNGKLVARDGLGNLTERVRKENATRGLEASLEARGLRRWTEKDIERVFWLAYCPLAEKRFRYHGNVNLKSIANEVGRTRDAVGTCLKKKENKQRYSPDCRS